MENTTPNQPWSYTPMPPREYPVYSAGRKERSFAVVAVLCGLLLCNFILAGGFNLGFAIGSVACILGSGIYLWSAGCRPGGYSGALLLLSMVIAAGFGRSADGFVKFVMLCFLLFGANLGLCLMAGQNRRDPGRLGTLWDAFRGAFVMSFDMGPAFRGLSRAFRGSGAAVKKGGSVLLGLMVAVPLLLIMVPLLISADAAFEGLLLKLPQFDLSEAISTAIFGTVAACLLYAQGVALRQRPKQAAAATVFTGGWGAVTVNTVLLAVCAVYAVYLLSQMAYFFGSFSGILPKSFTMAEYARRGFFEMAWLSAIDLGIMALAMGVVVKPEGKAPLSTRLLCLFIGIVTVVLVATASAKMLMYIDSYGLTRLRVLTEVVMVFLAVATAVVCLWLFLPKLAYMKVLVLFALAVGAAVLWADVDTVVASYNVSAYRSGKLEKIDLAYLEDLGASAIPHIAKLTDDADPKVAKQAKEIIADSYADWNDFRDWNYVNYAASKWSDPE